MDILKHHGILGQKWGVRRFQNKDGSLTVAGRLRYGSGVKKYSHDSKRANDIYKTLTREEKIHLTGNAYDEKPHPDSKYEYSDENYKKAAIYSSIIEIKDVPVSMLDVYKHGDKGLIAITVRNESKYRNIGIAKEQVKEVLDWFDKNQDIMQLDWAAFADNMASQKLAEKMGFEFNEADSDDKVKIYSKTKDPQTVGKYNGSDDFAELHEILDMDYKSGNISKEQYEKDSNKLFEEENKTYGLKSDAYYENLYNKGLEDPSIKKV